MSLFRYNKNFANACQASFRASFRAVAVTLFLILLSAAMLPANSSSNEIAQDRKQYDHYTDYSAAAAEYYQKALPLLINDNDVEQAEEFAVSAFNLARVAEDLYMMSKAQHLLGMVHYFAGDHQKSSAFYRNALMRASDISISENEETLELKENIWNNLGINYDLTGQIEKSANAYENSIRYALRLGNTKGLYITRINLGLIQTRVGLFEEASQNLRAAERFFRETNDIYYLAVALQNRGTYSSYRNDLTTALFFLKKAHDYFEQSGNTHGLNQLRIDLIRVYIAMDAYDDASLLISKLTDGDNLPEITGYDSAALTLLYGILLKEYHQDFSSARYYLEKADEGIMAFGGSNSDMLFLHLAELYAEAGEIEKFRRTMDRYHATRNSTNNNFARLRHLTNFLSDDEALPIEERLLAYNNQGPGFLAYALGAAGFFAFAFLLFMLQKRYFRKAGFRKETERLRLDSDKTIAAISTSGYGHKNQNSGLRYDSARSHLSQSRNKQSSMSVLGSSQDDKGDACTESVKGRMPFTDYSRIAISNQQNNAFYNFDINNNGPDTEEEKLQLLYDEAKRCVEGNMLYQDPNITLSTLSYKLGSNEKYVSMAINKNNEGGFTALINDYRVNHAKKLLL